MAAGTAAAGELSPLVVVAACGGRLMTEEGTKQLQLISAAPSELSLNTFLFTLNFFFNPRPTGFKNIYIYRKKYALSRRPGKFSWTVLRKIKWGDICTVPWLRKTKIKL